MAGRPREFDRREALAKARDAFWARGYEGVSMADLVAMLGLASARIYAAFGSKRELFEEAVALYEAEEGGFADRAFAEETTAAAAIERMLREATELYARPGAALGCLVVSGAVNCASENDAVRERLAERRRARATSISARLEQGVRDGDLARETDVESLGEHFGALLHGLSVQARDGVPHERLLAAIAPSLRLLRDAGTLGHRGSDRHEATPD